MDPLLNCAEFKIQGPIPTFRLPSLRRSTSAQFCKGSVFWCYIVHALQSGRKDKVVEYFGMNGNNLLLKSYDWTPWFGSHSLFKEPKLGSSISKEDCSSPSFCVFSLRSSMVLISSEKNTISRLKKDNKHLNLKLSQLQALLEEEALLGQSKRNMRATNSWTTSSGIDDENLLLSTSSEEICAPTTSHLGRRKQSEECAATEPAKIISCRVKSSSGHDSYSASSLHASYGGIGDTTQRFYGSHFVENGREVLGEEEFPEVSLEFQEAFLGHTKSNYSSQNILLPWAASTVHSLHAVYGHMTHQFQLLEMRPYIAELRLCCLTGNANLTVCVLDLKCSPVEPIFFSAASSRSYTIKRLADELLVVCKLDVILLSGLVQTLLTIWECFFDCMEHENMETMTVLPLGEDPPAITSLCFNHNGKFLAASATDGMIHMFVTEQLEETGGQHSARLLENAEASKLSQRNFR
ncbi:hypothetical protein CRYUN_Cryun13aG0083100 [Craigia yunnanensis]